MMSSPGEMIDPASFGTGRVAIHDTEFDLGELVALQCDRVLPIAQGKDLDLVIDPCRLRLRTDRGKLGRVIGNLIGNAIQFTSEGRVTISCGLTELERVFVRVSDTGRGIRTEDLHGIFTGFAQFEQSRPGTGSGEGSGLPMARRMARLLGGEIEVESQWGRGSAFTVLLPPSCLVASEGTAWECFLGRSS